MKYLTVALLIVLIAGLEYFHVFSADHAPEAQVCLAPQGKLEAMREMLLLHLGGH